MDVVFLRLDCGANRSTMRACTFNGVLHRALADVGVLRGRSSAASLAIHLETGCRSAIGLRFSGHLGGLLGLLSRQRAGPGTRHACGAVSLSSLGTGSPKECKARGHGWFPKQPQLRSNWRSAWRGTVGLVLPGAQRQTGRSMSCAGRLTGCGGGACAAAVLSC